MKKISVFLLLCFGFLLFFSLGGCKEKVSANEQKESTYKNTTHPQDHHAEISHTSDFVSVGTAKEEINSAHIKRDTESHHTSDSASVSTAKEEINSAHVKRDTESHHTSDSASVSTKEEINSEHVERDAESAIVNSPPERERVTHLLDSRFKWSQFFLVTLGLILLYFLLTFIRKVLYNKNLLGEFRLPLLKVIDRTLLFYEPIVILILVSIFVLIRPSLHGLWVVLLIIGGFSHIKNYISGRILQLEQGIAVGNQIRFGGQKGMISNIGRLGLQLKSGKGTHHLSYSKLMSEGFTQSSGEEVGGLHKLKISPKEGMNKNPLVHLKDLMATTPYLDWNYQPTLSKGEDNHYQAKVMVREEGHLQDLVRLVEEWGYECQIV